jgi:hypothetical protein
MKIFRKLVETSFQGRWGGSCFKKEQRREGMENVKPILEEIVM